MREPLEERLRKALGRLPGLEPDRDLVAAARARHGVVAAAPRRGWVLAALGTAALAASAAFVWWPAPSPPRDTPRTPTLVVLEVSGEVWLGEGDARVPLRTGDWLRGDAMVATAAGGHATLLDVGASTVTLSEATNARWKAAETDVTHVEVGRGVVRIDARQALVPLVVTVAGSADRVRLEDGSVGVVAGSGGGSFAVLEGEAMLERSGTIETVTRGREVVARDGEANDTATELRLTLAPVAPLAPSEETLTITGETHPGVLVTINGRDVAVDADGRFSADVVVTAASRSIVIIARDALDRSRRAVLALRRDAPKEPRERPTKTQWEWERTPG